MVSFSCEACGDVLTKKSLDKHKNQCRGASFTCLDCMTHFRGGEYRSHTSCISEAQKYEGKLYREKQKGGARDKGRSMNGQNNNAQAMVPRRAYVEDAPEGDDSQAVAVVDVPPRAPTPPPAPEPVGELPDNVNVFDFLVSEGAPNDGKTVLHTPNDRRTTGRSVRFENGDSRDASQYMEYGFSYGHAPVEPTFNRYDSWQNLTDSQQSQAIMPPPQYVTPAPKDQRRERRDRHTAEKSDKKRKRNQVDGLDLNSTKRPPSRDEVMVDAPSTAPTGRVLHSGLTGGLNKLVTDPAFYDDRIDAGPTPTLSPLKRSRREETRREDDDKKDRRKSSYVSYSSANSSKPSSSRHTDIKHYRSRSAERISAERNYHDDRHRRPERHNHDDKYRHRKRRDSTSSDDRPNRKHLKAIEYPDRPSSVQPNDTNQMVSYKSRGDLFMSFITKGPDSERGCSINKVLKRYHRERSVRGEEKEDEDKELWKMLRLRRNDRGEIVLFAP